MACSAHEEALRMIRDSDEESTCSSESEDDEDVDDEGLHSEDQFDSAQDTFSEE